jgi:tetratricopeptide (TPR) repeat protein
VQSKIKSEIERHSYKLEDLRFLAEKLGLIDFKNDNSQTLISKISQIEDWKKFNKALRRFWWNRNKNDIFGWVTVLGLLAGILGVVLIFFPPDTNIPQKLEEIIEKKQIDPKDRKVVLEKITKEYKQLLADLSSYPADAAFVKKARESLEEGDIDAAKAYLKQVKTTSKEMQAMSAYQLGKLYEIELEYEKAKTEYEEARSLQPKNTRYINAIGSVMIELGEYLGAKGNLERALNSTISTNRWTPSPPIFGWKRFAIYQFFNIMTRPFQLLSLPVFYALIRL